MNGPIKNDLGLITISVSLVAIYCLLFLGGFSPINSRVLLCILGLASVAASYFSAMGLLGYLGVKTSTINGILPFLLIGIGADDIFVIT